VFASLPLAPPDREAKYIHVIRLSERPPARLYQIPQNWEQFGFFLPRPLLDWAEIHARPVSFSPQETEEALRFWRSRKVALVKQTAYALLYPSSSAGGWEETVLSSICHLGPFSFLADLGADYFVVRQAKEPETFLWKEKFAYDPDPAASYRAKWGEIEQAENTPAGRNLPSVDDIPWHEYDLVVGIDVPVPQRIVKKCPRTLWAYLSIEAGGPLQKDSLRRPAAGYGLFLNHGFRRYRTRPANRPHVLEFPLQFQSQAAWHRLRKKLDYWAPRTRILVEKNSWEEPPPPSAAPLDQPSGDAREYLEKMFSSLVCLHTTAKTRWGNWSIEAVFSGSVFLGNAASLAHLTALLPGLDCRSMRNAVDLANRLIADPPRWQALQELQADVIENLCFRRPLIELTKKAREFLR